jgi:hypothetical protein
MVKPETPNWRFESTGLATPGKSQGLMVTGLGLPHQETGGRVFGLAWTCTNCSQRSKPGLVAGHPDTFLTLGRCSDLKDEWNRETGLEVREVSRITASK